jgi:hypothetical protein
VAPEHIQAVSHAQAPGGAAAGPGRGVPVRIEPGTLMEKMIPRNLVEPYLTGQRSVISGYAYQATDAAQAGPAWPALAGGQRGTGEAGDAPDFWVLRWRSLELQTYLTLPRPSGHPRRVAFDLFIEPCTVPVGTEMYRITPAREEFIARHDGQAWLRPAPEA